MANTTTTAIREALESVILGLTPTGKPMVRQKYARAGAGFSWLDRPVNDMDRHFTIGYIDEGEPQFFGSVSDVHYEGEFVITIGHKIQQSHEQDSLDRCNTDCCQIREQMEKGGNLPSGVYLIRYTGRNESINDDRILSLLKFRTIHSRALP